GGLGLPSLNAIYNATRLKQVYDIASYNARFVHPPPRNTPTTRTPDWIPLLMHSWHRAVLERHSKNNRNSNIPITLTTTLSHLLRFFLFDPFSQTDGWAKLPANAWPPALRDAFSICNSNQLAQKADFAHTLEAGSSLKRPALAHPNNILDLFDGRSAEYSIFFQGIVDYYYSLEGFSVPFTISVLPGVIAKIADAEQSEKTNNVRLYPELIIQLTAYYERHCIGLCPLAPESLACHYMRNWAYGLPHTTPVPDAITQY
ncbi:hypothetical protein IWW57_004123, partial [Coemansia sp. S610]